MAREREAEKLPLHRREVVEEDAYRMEKVAQGGPG
jgi:hypothetical protein